MKANLTIIVIAAVLSFFVTNANACVGAEPGSLARCSSGGDGSTTINTPWLPIGGTMPGLIPSVERTAVPTEQPSAQHLAILADIRAKNKEATRQWWINFFNNK